MANIYENCDLNISALSSPDSHAGLFSYRGNPDRLDRVCIRLQDGRFLTIRLYIGSSELHEESRSSPLSSRGWILQEKLLSPAIIHFGQRCVYWECCSGTRSECYANDERPGGGLLKNMIIEDYRPGYIDYPEGYFIAWYTTMALYSSMNLTLETDRLLALSGLVTRFHNMFSTTFLAGVWLEDLHRGLLWRTMIPGGERTNLLSRSYFPANINIMSPVLHFPSWSWLARMKGCVVNFETELSKDVVSVAHPVERLVKPRTDASFVSPHVRSYPRIRPGPVKDELRLWGIVTRVRTSKLLREDKFLRCNILKSIRVPPTMRPSQSTPSEAQTSHIRELPCFMDRPSLKARALYCLVIADWRYEYSFERFLRYKDDRFEASKNLRCYLLLQRVQSPPLRNGQNPSDLGIFKRVGMGMAEVDVVDTFFGSANETRRFLKVI